MIRRLRRMIQQFEDDLEDALDVWPEDEPIPYELVERAA